MSNSQSFREIIPHIEIEVDEKLSFLLESEDDDNFMYRMERKDILKKIGSETKSLVDLLIELLINLSPIYKMKSEEHYKKYVKI